MRAVLFRLLSTAGTICVEHTAASSEYLIFQWRDSKYLANPSR